MRHLLSSPVGDGATAVRDRALLALLVGHALRTVEIERLNVVDVDLAARSLPARGKTRDRTVYLRGDVAGRLRVLLQSRGHAPLDAPVFVSCGRNEHAGRGRRLSRRGIRFVVDRAYALAGLVDRGKGRKGRKLRRACVGAKSAARVVDAKVPTAHGLCATNVTLAIARGAPIEHVSRDVGHADVRTTMRYLDLQKRRENDRHPVHVTIDHIHPLSEAGEHGSVDRLDNLQLAHQVCNGRRAQLATIRRSGSRGR